MNTNSKILSQSEISSIIKTWKAAGEKIVLTNGCFDIFHYGHLCLLHEAKKFGTKLIVALNSDLSVKELKGANRPINEELHRASLLAALEIVDAVVIFEEATPEDLIQNLKPNILVKGGDYDVSQIAGANFVIENGGEVRIVPLVKGFSTSKILSLLKRE